MSKQKRFYLSEKELPTQWYNIQADLKQSLFPCLIHKLKSQWVLKIWHISSL